MRKIFTGTLIAAAMAVLLAGCASFGIRGAAVADGREGKEYTLQVRAWDKKADNLSVVFMYRVNGGQWQQRNGVFNGTLYEVVVHGSELPAGTLEYYASMTNSKGDKVTSQPTLVRILSFAQAKAQAEAVYLSRLSDGGTDAEFIYNENALFKLKISGNQTPAAVSVNVITSAGPRALNALNTSGVYEAVLNAPLPGSSCTYQWAVKWNDAEFGELTSLYPSTPKAVPILDQAALRARLEKDFRAALVHPGRVTGNYFQPPVIKATLNYSPLLTRYTTGIRQVTLLLRRNNLVTPIQMIPGDNNVYSAEVPAAELENGPMTYSFKYTDTFTAAGPLSADFPAGQTLSIAYRTYADMTREAVTALQAKFAHQAPSDAQEGAALSLKVDVLDSALQVLSLTLDGTGPNPIGKGVTFMQNQLSWHAAIPGTFVRAGLSGYTLTATVRDSRFGDLKVPLPATGQYTVSVKSLAQLRAEREAALLQGLIHTVPGAVTQNQPLLLTLSQTPAVANAAASLYYRTAASAAYRELRATPVNGLFTFTVPAAETSSNYIQYYFTVRLTTAELGALSATLRNTAGGVASDFIVTPGAAVATPGTSTPVTPVNPPLTPLPPVTPPVTPPTTPVTPGTSPATPPATTPATPATPATPPASSADFDVESYYQGPQADQGGVRFFVTLKNQLGLYDLSVMIKITGRDADFREFPMERRGKEYAYTFDSSALPVGTRLEFYYQATRRNSAPQRLSAANALPFTATITQSSAVERTPRR